MALVPGVSRNWGQELLDSLLTVFTPEAYGAIGNGVADDTAAVRACFDAANALARSGIGGYQPGATVVLTGTYKLTSIAAPIDVLCNVTANRAEFTVPDAYAGVAVRVGHTTSGQNFQCAEVNLPDVVKSNSASIVAGSVGVKTLNIGNSRINFARTAFFETGLWFSGLGQGTAYNRIHIGFVMYCKVSLQLKPDTAGWVNQNTFVGGGIQQSAGSFGGGLRRSGWYHLLMDGAGINPVNGNTFVGVSFEGDVSEHVFHILNSYANFWLGCRHEQGTAGVSVAATGGGSATLTATAHGMAVDDTVVFTATVVPTGMFDRSPYYVVSVPTADTFTVSPKKGGTAVTFSTTGTSVLFWRPSKVWFDTANATNHVIRNPAMAATPGVLELIKSGGTNTGNVVEMVDTKVSDTWYLNDLPPFRARNRSSQVGSRPMFAAYPAAADPTEDPYGWTAGLSDIGPVFATSGAETGRLSASSTGVLKWKRPADSAAVDVPTAVRNQAGALSITSLSCAANTTTTTTITLTGASVSDHAHVTMLSHVAGIVFSHAYVSSANTLTLVFGNITGSTISLTTTVEAMVIRRYF